MYLVCELPLEESLGGPEHFAFSQKPLMVFDYPRVEAILIYLIYYLAKHPAKRRVLSNL